MFIEEKYGREEIIYPVDYEEVLSLLHEDEFDCDEYFGATIDVLDLETGLQQTILLSAWFEMNDSGFEHNFIIIND